MIISANYHGDKIHQYEQPYCNIEKVLNGSNSFTLQSSKSNTNDEVTISQIVVTKEQKDILVILDKVSTPDISPNQNKMIR